MIPWVTLTRSHFVEFAYKTNRICILQARLPSHPPPVSHFVEFVYEFAIRGRIGKRPFRIEIRLYEIRLYEIQFVYTNFVLPEIRIRIQRISLNSYTNFQIRLYEFRLQTNSSIRNSSQGRRNGPETNFVYEFRIRIRHLGTKFVYEIRLRFQFGTEFS